MAIALDRERFIRFFTEMERGRLLKSDLRNVTGRRRRVSRIRAAGRKVLEKARIMFDELHHKLHEEHPRRVSILGDEEKPGMTFGELRGTGNVAG